MTTAQSIFETDLENMITDASNLFRSTLVWGSQTVYGTRAEVEREDDDEMAGFRDGSNLQWIGKMSDFSGSTPPGIRQEVTIDGDAYYVEGRSIAQDSVSVTLRLKAKI